MVQRDHVALGVTHAHMHKYLLIEREVWEIRGGPLSCTIVACVCTGECVLLVLLTGYMKPREEWEVLPCVLNENVFRQLMSDLQLTDRGAIFTPSSLPYIPQLSSVL